MQNFSGVSLNDLPCDKFAGFLLTTLHLFSLATRTVYLGSYNKLLQSNMRHEGVQTVDEMIERDLKFYFYPWFIDLFNESEAMNNRSIRQIDAVCSISASHFSRIVKTTSDEIKIHSKSFI